MSLTERVGTEHMEMPADGGATTRGADALGLPEARQLSFSARAWLDEPFSRRNMALVTARAGPAGSGSGEHD